MIADLKEAVHLSKAAREWFPMSRAGTPIHASVLIRWSNEGVRAPNGKRVFLRLNRVGSQCVVTKEAVEEFLTALNPGSSKSKGNASTDAGRRASELGKALEKLGC